MDHREAVDTLAMERYLLEEMTGEERDAFEAHVFSCAECAEDARLAAMMRDGAARGLAAAIPFRQSKAGWRSSVALPWAAAAVLAVGLGYQMLESPAAAHHEPEALPLIPATLRPESRGGEAVVSPGPGGLVTLAIDLGDAPFEHAIRYEVSGSDGKTLASGEAATPVPGSPLLLEMLRLPSGGASGHYVLTLHRVQAPGLTPATYRFRVKAP